MSGSNSGNCSSKSDPGVSDFDHWGFESSNLDDEIAIYMDDFASPFPFASQQAQSAGGGLRVVNIDISDDIWENAILRDLVAMEEEESNQFGNLINPIDNVEEFSLSSSNMNLDWDHVLPITNLEEFLTEILMFEVDFTQPQLGVRVRSASKKLVENLPLVDLRKEDRIVCTVCRDEIEEGEIANKLPYAHFYHRACIVPWLKINNICPVCRYELPTD